MYKNAICSPCFMEGIFAMMNLRPLAAGKGGKGGGITEFWTQYERQPAGLQVSGLRGARGGEEVGMGSKGRGGEKRKGKK